MATGIPKSHLARKSTLPTSPRSEQPRLVYDSKRSTQSILEASPVDLVSVWGETSSANRLYYGDNSQVSTSLLHDPDVHGKVRLIYIDPPYATNSVFQSRSQTDAYSDLLAGSHYIEFLRERLVLLRELLAEDGSIYVHLDENMAFHIKVIMDEIFGQSNFRNWITRKKCNPKNYTRKTYGNISDFILFYTKTDDYVWHRPVEGWTPERAMKEYSYIEGATGRRYKKVPVHAPGVRNGTTGKSWRGMMPPPGKHWQYTPQKLDEFDARGEIYWSPNGNPRRKVYLDESEGIPVQDIWLDYRDAHNQNIEITGYPTEKNPNLLARIIEASSNSGDLVLDCFCGSGTLLSVASGLNRRWIGVDNSLEAIQTTLRRFALGTQPMGDFVSARNGNGAKSTQNETLSLFDLTDISKIESESSKHIPITNFTFLSEDTLTPKLSSTLKEWKKNIGQLKGDLFLKEQPAKYVARTKVKKSQRKHKTKSRR